MKTYKIAIVMLLGVTLALGVGLAGCKDKTLSARALANALADEFSDGLEFENEELVSGAPIEDLFPSPKLTYMNAPHAIGPTTLGLMEMADYDTWFAVDLQADAAIDPMAVDRAIIHVVQANKDDSAEYYRIVTPTAGDIVGSTMTLRARMNYFADVPGNAFHVRVALLNAAGTQVSNWFYWNLVTYPLNQTDQTTVPMCLCQQQTDWIDPDGVPDNGDEWYKLRSTNLRFVNRSACQNTTDGDYTVWEFYGTADTGDGFAYDANPCMLWQSCYGGYDAGHEFPAGARFFPYWFMDGEDPRACQLELNCPSSSGAVQPD